MPTRSRQLLVKNYGKWLLNRRVTIGCIILAVTFSMAYSAAAQLTPSPPALLNTNGDSDLGHDYEPQVTTDGTGNWVAVFAAGSFFGVGPDFDVFVATFMIDNVGPIVTVDVLVTNDTTPALSGSIDDPTATISVTVNGQTHPATNNGATWDLADDTLSPLASGTYDIVVAAQDLAGNIGTDATSDELTIAPPVPAAGNWALGLLTLTLFLAGCATAVGREARSTGGMN